MEGLAMSEPTAGAEDPGMVLPSSDKPVQIPGGLVVGPSLDVVQRQVRLIRPRRWRQVEASRIQGIWFLECPYCLSLVGDDRAGDEHLWRLHSDNTSNRAGQMNLLPMLVDVQRRLDLLIDDLGIDENAMARAVETPVHEMTDRKRRRTHRRLYR